MLTIYKFKIGSSGEIEVPEDAILLKVAIQNGELMAWYELHTDNYRYRLDRYTLVPTGVDMDDYYYYNKPGQYIDTVFLDNGLVWHIYCRTNCG